MRARPLIAVLLIVATTTTAAARARTLAPLLDPPVETQDTTQPTPDEELEARAIAGEFIRRFESSDDLLSIVDDLYVSDFNERLRPNVADAFLVPIDSELALNVKGDELRRCHIATLKLIYLSVLISKAWYSIHNVDGNPRLENSDEELDPMEALPPRAVDLLKNDPAFAEMIFEASKKGTEAKSEQEQQESTEENEKKVEEKDQTIRDIERLRSYVSIIEQAVAAMREHLQTLPAPHTWQAMADAMRDPGESSPSDGLRPRVTILTSDSFGCPAGTRLICLDVMLFHMDLVRIDGQLKILYVSMADD
jgi:hypothetical protein